MKDIFINGNLYDSTELAKKYYSLRDFLPKIDILQNSIPFIIVNENLEIKAIDYFDGEIFQEYDPIDLPFTEYKKCNVLKVETSDGGLGFDGGEFWTLIELYENIERWASGHPLAVNFVFMLFSYYGIPRLKAMFKVLKKKGLKCKASYFSNAIKYELPKDLDNYIDFKKMEDDLENTK